MNADTQGLQLLGAGVAALSERLQRGDVSSTQLTEAYLARIGVHDRRINSYIAVTADIARAAAAESDKRRKSGALRGPLDGVPIALKDNIDVAGIATTAGVEARRKRIAATDAPVTARLKAAGAVILGKLNMHEGAHGATTANEAFGFCFNPHRHDYTPGGSSGGSGAALAAGMCAGALGTDTLGSIRIPSSFCGIAGLKPTQGLVSTRGVVPLAFSLDHVGPMAPRIADLALMLEAMACGDAGDPFSAVPPQAIDYRLDPPASLRGIRLGRLTDLPGAAGDALNADVAKGFDAALDVLKNLGAEIVPVELEGFRHNDVRAKALLAIEADLAVFYADELERNPNGFTPLFREGVEFGRQQSAPRLAAAYESMRAVRAVAAKLFNTVDALVTPATPCTAFSFKQPMPKTLTAFTAFGNYAGAPSVSVPMGLSREKLPMGLLVTGRRFADMQVLRIAAAYERAANWNLAPAGF